MGAEESKVEDLEGDGAAGGERKYDLDPFYSKTDAVTNI